VSASPAGFLPTRLTKSLDSGGHPPFEMLPAPSESMSDSYHSSCKGSTF